MSKDTRLSVLAESLINVLPEALTSPSSAQYNNGMRVVAGIANALPYAVYFRIELEKGQQDVTIAVQVKAFYDFFDRAGGNTHSLVVPVDMILGDDPAFRKIIESAVRVIVRNMVPSVKPFGAVKTPERANLLAEYFKKETGLKYMPTLSA